MNRRTCLTGLAVAGAALPRQVPATKPIELHIDLEAAPGREKQLISAFRTVFEPAVRGQPGFVSVRLLKLREEIAGKNPTTAGYRLVLSFETEQQRLAWVATEAHHRAWPEIAKTLAGMKAIAMLYEAA